MRRESFRTTWFRKGVNAAVENGCFYFSSAGNEGNLNDDTAGVWEGDFADDGVDLHIDDMSIGDQHEFAEGVSANRITDVARIYLLKWADPLSASANDYDLYLLDESLMEVVRASTNMQDGEHDPLEWLDGGFTDDIDRHLVVVRASGEGRYLRLNAFGGEMEDVTAGQTFGHSAAANAIGVAAVDALSAGGDGGVFDGSESVQTFSSDGPRRVFFEPDGTPITPGDFSSSGGAALDKPDVAAADNVSTSTPGFDSFEGTSAAAPHAAAIAALMLEAAGGRNRIDLAALRSALAGAALDIEAQGIDRDSGAGIPLAPAAVGAVAAVTEHRAPTVDGLQDQTLHVRGNDLKLDLSTAFDDPDGDALTYTVLLGTEGYVAITRSGSVLTIDPLAPGTVTLMVRATDPGGLSVVRTITVTVDRDYGATDYDTDDDGLIEVATLEQLYVIRYDLNGDGATEIPADWELYFEAFQDAQEDMGCSGGCGGFELAADLDFDDPASYASGAVDRGWSRGEGAAGWEPIGIRDENGSQDGAFGVPFDGNGHTIANLFIDRRERDYVGLFGYVNQGPVVNVGLTDMDITGNKHVGGLVGYFRNFLDGRPARLGGPGVRASFATGRVSGGNAVGGLLGTNWVSIRHCYASVRVTGDRAVGGLVARQEANVIHSSFATGAVSGKTVVGGLVGVSWDPVVASYATGAVSGEGSRTSYFCGLEGGVGGLIGHACGSWVVASYATGRVRAARAAGGLVGSKSGVRITIRSSYWDVETSGIVVGVGDDDANDNGTLDGDELPTPGVGGMTTAELQTPTGYEGIYGEWQRTPGDLPSHDDWNFGTALQYPALKADVSRDGAGTWQEFGTQIRDRPELALTTAGGQASLAWTPVTDDHWRPEPEVTYAIYRDDVIVATDISADSYIDTPPEGDSGSVRYQVTAIVDGGEASRSNLVRASNLPPAPPPVANRSARAGTSFTYTFGRAIDPDGDSITYTATGFPGWLTFAASSRTFAGTPGQGDVDAHEITVTAADHGTPVQSASTTFTLTVIESNASNRSPAPVGTLDAVSLSTGATRTVLVQDAFEDADGDVLGYSAETSDNEVAAVHASGGAVVVTGVAAGEAIVTVTASDGALTATQTFAVTVVNAEPEALGSLADRTMLIPGAPVILAGSDAFQDADGDVLTYDASTSHADVVRARVSGSTVTLTALSVGSATITVTATDADGSNSTATQTFEVTVLRDYDVDDDGLIEIGELRQLDAVRYDRDGDGKVDLPPGLFVDEPLPDDLVAYETAYPDAAAKMGCESLNGCTGYELVADLDFDTNGSGDADEGDAYWNNGQGWVPLGRPARSGNPLPFEPYRATFDGNGHVISNLFIRRRGHVIGLFGFIYELDDFRLGIVRNVGLTDVDVSGCRATGSLAGRNNSVITSSYATGRVRGIAPRFCDHIGGLVGENEWIDSGGVIRNSYASVAVSASGIIVGGLVGRNGRMSRIHGSFATGAVEARSDSGGLVGVNIGQISASYATGRPISSLLDLESGFGLVEVGGLAGSSSGQILDSYWDTRTSGWQLGVGVDDRDRNGRVDGNETATPGALGKNTAELQAPEAYRGIYEHWNADGLNSWHFGSSTQYPVLRADLDGDGRASWQEFGYQLRDTPRLSAAIEGGKAKLAWSTVDTSYWDPEPPVRYAVFRDGEVLATDIEGSTYTDDSPGVDYQIVALINGGEKSRSGIAVVVENCYAGTTWRPGEKCKIAPTSFALEINEDGTACVASECSTGGSLNIHIQTGHILIRVVAARDADNTWILRELVPAGPVNRAPIALGLIKPVTLSPEDKPRTVDVSLYFEDPDGDKLTYSAMTSSAGVATVNIFDGLLTITPSGEGRAMVTVTARDTDGLSAIQAVDVTVESLDFFRWAGGWRLKLLSDIAANSRDDSDDAPQTDGSDAGEP